MRTYRIIAFCAYGVGILLLGVFAAFYVLNTALLAMSSPGLSSEPQVHARGTVVFAGPGQVYNQDEIDEARRAAEAEGLGPEEAWIPEASVGSCTVTYAFEVDGARYEATELNPRQSAWCDLKVGDPVDLAYPVGHPEKSHDDYDKAWHDGQRDGNVVLAAIAGAAAVVIAFGVVVHVRGRRSAAAERAAAELVDRTPAQ